MKKVLSYYYIPTGIFLLLALLDYTNTESQNLLMTIAGALAIGLFAGVVFHLVTKVMKKISN
ncbi:hypothetical protein [Halalkalibacter nanhaiisediminis]|uniref:Uncharacterized protein n=1 Tax=Halalkalibacter nanhaiisediminis TaxID=688079 RepID=A0A562QHG8_9BACI|nr:hypothetical protein [Halalkalibacter nanhaiisediminis]TWI56197.1 hypothetical protein IQ10_02088 [Halalkalibacter nanhaiisediminis]